MNTGQFPTILADEYHAAIARMKPHRTEARASRPQTIHHHTPSAFPLFGAGESFFVPENNFFRKPFDTFEIFL